MSKSGRLGDRVVLYLLSEANDFLLDVNEAHGLCIPYDGCYETFRGGDCNAQVNVVTINNLVSLLLVNIRRR